MDNKYEVDKEDILEIKQLLERMYKEIENSKVVGLGFHQGYILEMAIMINRIIKENEIKY